MRLESSSSLEHLLQMGGSEANGPLNQFPTDVNKNVYSDIVKYFIENARNLVIFFLNIMVDKSRPLENRDVLRLAFILSYLAHSVNRGNDALVKLKSIALHKDGLTFEGLDSLAALGLTETSRSLRKQTEYLACISSDLVQSASAHYPYQSTIDNLGKC